LWHCLACFPLCLPPCLCASIGLCDLPRHKLANILSAQYTQPTPTVGAHRPHPSAHACWQSNNRLTQYVRRCCCCCRQAYHPLCARRVGLHMEMADPAEPDGPLQLVSHCPKHCTPSTHASGASVVCVWVHVFAVCDTHCPKPCTRSTQRQVRS
jgi:hypothetical protein